MSKTFFNPSYFYNYTFQNKTLDDIEMKNPIRTLGEHEISVSPYLNITHTLKIKVNKN